MKLYAQPLTQYLHHSLCTTINLSKYNQITQKPTLSTLRNYNQLYYSFKITPITINYISFGIHAIALLSSPQTTSVPEIMTDAESTMQPFTPVRGNYHQGHYTFKHSGVQCVPNSVVSVIYSTIKDVHSWTPDDLDSILYVGDKLYGDMKPSLQRNETHFVVSRLPHTIHVFDTRYVLDTAQEPLPGIINRNGNNETLGILHSLYDAFHISLTTFKACCVTFNCATFAVITTDAAYYVFDSHSRNATGIVDPDGASILLRFTSIQELCEHCYNLALSMNVTINTQFDVTGINVYCEHTAQVIQTTHAPITTTQSTQAETLVKTIYPSVSTIIHQTDAVQVVETILSISHYLPLTAEDKIRLCTILGIQTKQTKSTIPHYTCLQISAPLKTRAITSDGNCFFRCISYAISNSEKYHHQVRTRHQSYTN